MFSRPVCHSQRTPLTCIKILFRQLHHAQHFIFLPVHGPDALSVLILHVSIHPLHFTNPNNCWPRCHICDPFVPSSYGAQSGPKRSLLNCSMPSWSPRPPFAGAGLRLMHADLISAAASPSRGPSTLPPEHPAFVHSRTTKSVSHQDHVYVCVFRRVFLASLGKATIVTLIDGRVAGEDHQASGHHERPKECHANGLI